MLVGVYEKTAVVRHGVLAVTLAALLCHDLAAPARGEPEKVDRPNVLLLLTDDQLFRAIGYENKRVKTPNIDRLAEQGLIFDRAYIAAPVCAASRASLLSGLYPQQHGVICINGAAFSDYVRRDDRATLAELMTDAGYRTGLYGKSHLGAPEGYGFDHGGVFGQPDDAPTFEAAHGFVENAAGDEAPFFLWLGLRQPHLPLRPGKWVNRYEEMTPKLPPNFRESPPQESIYNQGLPGEHFYRDSGYRDNYKNLPAGPPRDEETIRPFIRAYYGVISRLDHQIGRLVDKLKAEGQYEDTLIVFLSDNGYMLGHHGLGNKITMHEESVRVPMFITGPGVGRAGQRSKALVSSVDVPATILDMAGVPRPDYIEGRSLRGLLKEPDPDFREHVISECVGVGGGPGQGHRMVRTRRWKYVLTGANEEYLFDEREDPYEMNNIADQPAQHDRLRRMRRVLVDWMQRVGDGHARPGQ